MNNGWDKGKWMELYRRKFVARKDNNLQSKTYNLDCMKMGQRAEKF